MFERITGSKRAALPLGVTESQVNAPIPDPHVEAPALAGLPVVPPAIAKECRKMRPFLRERSIGTRPRTLLRGGDWSVSFHEFTLVKQRDDARRGVEAMSSVIPPSLSVGDAVGTSAIQTQVPLAHLNSKPQPHRSSSVVDQLERHQSDDGPLVQ